MTGPLFHRHEIRESQKQTNQQTRGKDSAMSCKMGRRKSAVEKASNLTPHPKFLQVETNRALKSSYLYLILLELGQELEKRDARMN